jgi:hypothetical protein
MKRLRKQQRRHIPGKRSAVGYPRARRIDQHRLEQARGQRLGAAHTARPRHDGRHQQQPDGAEKQLALVKSELGQHTSGASVDRDGAGVFDGRRRFAERHIPEAVIVDQAQQEDEYRANETLHLCSRIQVQMRRSPCSSAPTGRTAN